MKLFFGIVIILCLAHSCKNSNAETQNTSEISYSNENKITPSELEPKEYIQWSEKANKLINKRKFNELTYEMKCRTAEYMTLKSLGPDATSEEIKEELKSYTDLFYFNLRIQLNKEQVELLKYKVSGLQEYDQRIKYFSFDVDDDIWMVLDNRDSIKCGISHFERAYNVTNYTDILIGFDKKIVEKENKDWKKMTLVYRDKIFGNGIVKFEFDKNDITRTPTLLL